MTITTEYNSRKLMTQHPTRKKDDYVHNFKSITGISKRNPEKKKKKKTIIEISLRVQNELNHAKT